MPITSDPRAIIEFFDALDLSVADFISIECNTELTNKNHTIQLLIQMYLMVNFPFMPIHTIVGTTKQRMQIRTQLQV